MHRACGDTCGMMLRQRLGGRRIAMEEQDRATRSHFDIGHLGTQDVDRVHSGFSHDPRRWRG